MARAEISDENTDLLRRALEICQPPAFHKIYHVVTREVPGDIPEAFSVVVKQRRDSQMASLGIYPNRAGGLASDGKDRPSRPKLVRFLDGNALEATIPSTLMDDLAEDWIAARGGEVSWMDRRPEGLFERDPENHGPENQDSSSKDQDS